MILGGVFFLFKKKHESQWLQSTEKIAISPHHQCWDPWEPGQVHQFFQRRHCPTKQKASGLYQTHRGSRNPTRKLWSWICNVAKQGGKAKDNPKGRLWKAASWFEYVRMIRLSNPPKLAVVWPPNGLISFNFSAMVLDHVSHMFNMFSIPKIAHEKATQKAYPLVNSHITMENHRFQWVNPLFQWPWLQ